MGIFLKLMYYNVLTPSIIAIEKLLWTYGSSGHMYIYGRGWLVIENPHLLSPKQPVL